MDSPVQRRKRLQLLQDRLLTSRDTIVDSPGDMVLPFNVGNYLFAIPYAEVARVILPAAIVQVPRNQNVPSFVVGVAASEPDMLSIVDAAMLLLGAPMQATIKSRIIVMGEGPMKGFGLLVSRVQDLTSMALIDKDKAPALLTSEALNLHIASKNIANTERQ